MDNIHASLVSLQNKGILLLGKSGIGKSDLALRLIKGQGAVLVADDRTDIYVEQNVVMGSCPDNIKGLLEVRGVGIIKMQTIPHVQIKMVVELVDTPEQIERLPLPEYWEYKGIKIKKIKLYPFTESAVYKIILACDEKL